MEAILTSTHNQCFEQKYENSKKTSTENFHFYRREKLLYIAWACFRNDMNIDPPERLRNKKFNMGLLIRTASS